MKKGIKFLIFLLIATLFVGLSACGGKSSESESSSESQSTGGQQQEIEIAIIGGASVEEFETLTLTATVTGSEEDVVWSSSNPQVATVEGGVVSALSVGETVISASIGETTATHTVTVVASSYAHVMEFSVTSLALFEEESSSVNVYVSHKGERLDNATCGLEYVWTVVNGDENAVTLETSENGAVASFTGLSAGVVTYEVTTVARGYEVYAQFSVEVYETTLGLSFENTAIKPLEGGHGVELTLGSETTDRLTIGKILLVENGTPSDEEVSVQWTSADENVVTVESGVITAKKAGSATLTGIAVYDGEEITVTVSVSVLKLNVTIDDVITIETAVDSTITLPNTITESEIVKVTINSSNVVYDSLNEIGSLDGKVITVGENTMPSKMQDLGEGKTITVETDVKIYTINADVYTLIINDKQELDTWQEKAAENAIRAGICIEQQKGFAYSGYFVLGNNIDYNGQWKPYKDYNALWALSKDNTNNTELKDGDEYIDGVIEESWTAANYGGFQGTFDGKGYNIDGLEVLDRYSGFIVVMGTNGVVQNLSFTDAVIGSEAGLVVERGQGTVKDVYMEIDSFAEGAVTFYKKGSAPVRTVERVIIDVTDCKLTNLNSGFLGSECNGNAYIGVYVIGVGEDLANRLFDDVNEKSSIGYFADLTALVTDGNHGPNVSSWGDFWTVTENLVLPSSIINSYGGQISFVNSETVIAFGESITLATDKDAKYIRYSLKDEVENVSLSGNVLSADQNAVVGTPVTVVATSLIDGLTAEITLTVSNPLAYKTVETELYAETSSNSAILYYDGFVAGATYSVTVNGAISNATVEVDGQLTVTVSGLTVSTADSLSVYTIVCKNDVEQIEFTNVIAVTKILKTAEDINVLNGAKAGAGNYISGYYLLGNDIDCQDALYEAGSYSTGFFRAVFDGNGYTISNIKVGSCGIFGALYGATIKDVNFENVSIVSTANNFNALLAGSVTNNTTIENVNVTYKAIQWPYADSYAKNKMTGLLVARWNNTAHTVRNVTLNAGALTVTNALGYELSAVTFENVKVLANEVTLIGCTTAYDNETNLTSWPTGVTYTDTYEEITVDAQVIAEAGVVTLNNDKFIVGETYSVVCGSVTKTATVSTQGVLTVTMDGISTGAVTINCSTESKLVAFTNVLSVTKVIRNAEDLNVLNAYNASGHITGYYVLGNNINCNGATYSATGRDGNKQFQGIFDGQGYTISNLSVGANGIFNLIVGGTVKNVNFTDVSLVRDGNNYTALLAGQTWGNPIIENVNVTFKTIEWTYNNVFNASAITGLLVARWSNATATVTNVVIDATGLNITNALGTEITGVVFTNVTVKGDSYELIACTGANSSSGVSDWPSGVTFTDTFTAEIVDVIAPSESSYYTFSGQDYVIKGENYSFTITQDVSGLGDFIVLVNGVEVAGNNGTYTVENVVDELTVQVIHGYIEHGSNVTVEYSASGIKLTNAVVGSYNETNAPYLAWISADYINYMVSQGYSTVSFTVQTDNNLAQQAVASYNGTIFVYHVDGTAKEFTQSLTNSATAGLYFWVQNASGSGFAIKDQGAYLLITGLTFKKADLTVTAPAQSNYYTFTGNSTVENGKTYTFSVTVKVSGLNDFIVLVNGVEVTGNSGTYTVENVTEALTIKVIHGYIEYGAVSSVSYTDGVATVTNSTSAGTEAYMAYISADYVNYLMSQGHTYIDFYIAPDGSVADQAIVACGNTIVRTPSNYTSVARVTLKADTAIKFWCQQNGSGSAIQNQGGSMTVTRG